MLLLTETTVDIDRPISAVFEYVANMERFGEWFPGVVAIEASNGLEHGQVGKEYLETVSVPMRGTRKIALVVREALPGKFLATEGRFPPLLPRMEIVLAEAGTDGCRLTWRMFSRNDNLIVRYALLPLAARMMDKRAKAGVAALKKRLEGDPMPGAGTTE